MILETILHLVFGKLSLDALPSDPITLYGAGGVLFSGLFVVVATLTYFKSGNTFGPNGSVR